MRLTALRDTIKSDPFIQRISLLVSLIYGLIYYWTAGYIHINPQASSSILWVQDIKELIWHMRGPFQWEAIAVFPIPKVGQIWLSVPNLVIALILVLLVYGNLILIMIAFRHPRVCQLRKRGKNQSFLSLLPALFTGFSCCAPSVIILWVSIFGSVSSVMVAALRWFLPLGLAMLIVGIIAGFRSIPIASTEP